MITNDVNEIAILQKPIEAFVYGIFPSVLKNDMKDPCYIAKIETSFSMERKTKTMERIFKSSDFHFRRAMKLNFNDPFFYEREDVLEKSAFFVFTSSSSLEEYYTSISGEKIKVSDQNKEVARKLATKCFEEVISPYLSWTIDGTYRYLGLEKDPQRDHPLYANFYSNQKHIESALQEEALTYFEEQPPIERFSFNEDNLLEDLKGAHNWLDSGKNSGRLPILNSILTSDTCDLPLKQNKTGEFKVRNKHKGWARYVCYKSILIESK